MKWMIMAMALVAGGNAVCGEVVRLPGLIVRSEDSCIEIPGVLAQTNGILEFVAVEPKSRDYESLLTIECKPSVLQSALFLIGCETGAVWKAATNVNVKTGTKLSLEVCWVADGKTQCVPVETWLLDRNTKKAPTAMWWVFTGSTFVEHPLSKKMVFAADEERAHIALWYQSSIPVNVGGDYGNPYKSEAHGIEINSDVVPPVKTPVTLIIRKRKN